LETDGDDAGTLLQRVNAISPWDHFRVGAAYVMALDYRLDADSPPVLTHAEVSVFGLRLSLEASTVARMAADFELTRVAPDLIELPEDLLAVLGRGWSRLHRLPQGWRGSLYVPGAEPERSRRVAAQLESAAAHLAATFAAPPAQFHARWLRQRWGVYLRRATPLIVCLVLVAAAAAVPKLHLAEDSGLRMLIFNAPPLLMVLVFCLRDLPSIEIPPWPRRAAQAAWREVPAADAPRPELQLD